MNHHEIIPHQNNNSEAVAQFITTNERLADTVQRRDYFNGLSEDDFIDLVQTTASVIRGGKPHQKQNFDGENVALMLHEVPDQRDKESLIRKSWHVAQEYLNNPDISDQDALDYAAVTIAGGLLFAHPFIDGNGRTARTLSYIISQGSANAEELSEILGESNGGSKWHIAPEALVVEADNNFKGEQPDAIEWEDVFEDEATDSLGGQIANSIFKDRVIRRMIERLDVNAHDFIIDSKVEDRDGKTVISGEKFIEALASHPGSGLTDSQHLLTIYREERAGYIDRFLRSMQSRKPVDANKLIHQSNFDPGSEQDEFTKNRVAMIKIELGKRAMNGMILPADRQLIRHKAHSGIRHKELTS